MAQFQVLASVKMQIEADSEVQAMFKATCYLAAGDVMYGNGDVKVQSKELKKTGEAKVVATTAS